MVTKVRCSLIMNVLHSNISKPFELCNSIVFGHMSDPATEPDLWILTESSVDRPVEQAHTSICDDNIRFFDQFRINSFIDNHCTGTSEKRYSVAITNVCRRNPNVDLNAVVGEGS
jgi:hypothetical protein